VYYPEASPEIVSVPETRDQSYFHPSVLTAALTFFLGLVLVPLLLFPFLPHAAALSGYSDSLRNLQILTGIMTIIYVVLRRTEGDFRALFIISTGLFALTEGLDAVSRRLATHSLVPLEMQFATAMLVYSSLALTAAIAEGDRRNWYQRALVAAVTGFIGLAGMRVYFQMRGGGSGAWERIAILIVTTLVTLHVGGILVWGELRTFKRRQSEKILQFPTQPVAAGNGSSDEHDSQSATAEKSDSAHGI
jgi:hypothetical protein